MKESKEVYERISDQFEDFTSHASQRGVEVDTVRYMVHDLLGGVVGNQVLDLACGHGFSVAGSRTGARRGCMAWISRPA